MKLKPLGDRLIVRAIESDEDSSTTGLVLPEATAREAQIGQVLSVGDGGLDDEGRYLRFDVKEGDEVLYSKYGGTPITVDGETLVLLEATDVLGKDLAPIGISREVEEDPVTARLAELREGVRGNIAHLRELAK
jgi:chaperonin GroES